MSERSSGSAAGRQRGKTLIVAAVVTYFLGAVSIPYLNLIPPYLLAGVAIVGLLMIYSNREPS